MQWQKYQRHVGFLRLELFPRSTMRVAERGLDLGAAAMPRGVEDMGWSGDGGLVVPGSASAKGAGGGPQDEKIEHHACLICGQ